MSAIQGAGTPLQITSTNTWRGQDRTNGIVMRNTDGRIGALKEGYSSLAVGSGNVLFTDKIVPWGNALWRDTAQMGSKPGRVQADKPTKGEFVGILQFEQGLQAGHPVAGYGLNSAYMKGTLVREGLVGYKQALQAVGDAADYLLMLQGDRTKDVNTVRLVYDDWVTTLAAGADGDKLGLFFHNASGFPIVSLVVKAQLGYPLLANCTFAGFAEVFEKENKIIFFRLRNETWPLVAPST